MGVGPYQAGDCGVLPTMWRKRTSIVLLDIARSNLRFEGSEAGILLLEEIVL